MASEEYGSLQARLVADLANVALRCEDRDCRDLQYDEIQRVSDFDVREAARCQAKVAGPPAPFVADIFNTHKAVALLAVQKLHKSASVTEAVSQAMQAARGREDWLSEYLRGAPVDVRVQTAVRATTWLTRTLDVLDEGTPSRWQFDRKCEWRYPGRGLMLTAKVDLVRPADPAPTPILIAPNADDSSMDQVAFRLLLWCIASRGIPVEATVIIHATGKKVTVETTELLARGVEAAQRASDAVTLRPVGPHGLERSASHFTCMGCAWFEGCPARLASIDSSPTVRGGVRLAR